MILFSLNGFIEQRYAIAVLAVALSLSICVAYVSVSNWSSMKTAERIELVLAWELPSTYPTPRFKEILVSPKTAVLPSGTLF